MKVYLIQIIFTFISFFSFNQTVYFFPGQGSDERIFEKITLDSSFKKVYLSYPIPKKGVNMKEYAFEIAKKIDTSTAYSFVGVSLGGMMISELLDVYKPQKAIIISSAKCRSELPFRYRFQKYIPLNKIIPKRLIKIGAKILQPIVEADRNKNKKTFKAMLHSKHPRYLKRTVNLIVNWNKKEANPKIIHIHGSKDKTIPIRNVKNPIVIEKGSHMMTLTRGEELNVLLLKLLKN